MNKKPVDHEFYKGYVIILSTMDWDDMYKVYLNGKLLKEFQNRSDARAWVDSQKGGR